MKSHLAILLIAACGNSSTATDSNGAGSGTVDAKVFLDAPPVVPATITIMGTASARGLGSSTLVQGATIGGYKNSDENTPVATATTDAQGKFTLTITTNGQPVDGFIKATASTYLDTYLYPPAPLIADFLNAPVNLVTPSNASLVTDTLCKGPQLVTKGVIALIVTDAAMMPVAGATVLSSPASGSYCYTMGNPGVPAKAATATNTDGVAFMINVPATANVTISAMKTASTFSSHAVKARAGAFTTTVITQ